jgi:uncharacterized linocin/CFP29 family protein
MNHLLRSLAPISEAGWELLDSEARERLTPALAARRLVDFSGPHGWEYSATNLGRVAPLSGGPSEGVSGQQRRVLGVVELRADFELSRAELRDADRGADDSDWAPLDTAAHQLASAENAAVFGGWKGAFVGIAQASPHKPVRLGANAEAYPEKVAAAIELLLSSGVGGPYGVALGSSQYRSAIGTAEHGGYPLVEHLRKVIDGPIAWAPGVEGGVLVSLRGGDFVLECGQDASIGYEGHDGEVVRLYLEESFTFRVATPEAAVALQA